MSGATAVKVKDFVIDISTIKEEVQKKKKAKAQSQQQPVYEVILQNNTDFVIHRKTSTTDKNFVFLISQGLFYLQDNKSKDVEELNEIRIRTFFQFCLHNKFEALTEVAWWNSERLGYMVELMTAIISIPAIQKAYKHGIFIERHRVSSFIDSIDNNIKLFKYCYDKCNESNINKTNVENILKLATEIEQRINYNNAIYFIDRFCESNIKMNSIKDYRVGYDNFFNTIKVYNLDFNRFIDYISSDLYAQGIAEFNADVLRIYQDFLRMQISLYGRVKEKYPKYLRTEHDIVALKVTVYEQHKKDLMLLNVVDNYKGLEFKDKEYCIILPESTINIVEEGVQQSHCVASYVDKVVNNETLIVFMRKVDEPEKSLVTVEVRNDCITQAKGFANRSLYKGEKEFLQKWAKKKELQFNW